MGRGIAILVLATAMALREMGLADEIVSLAFGLTLGALAVAVAIALGLGGREIAATELKDWVKSIKNRRADEGRGEREITSRLVLGTTVRILLCVRKSYSGMDGDGGRGITI